MKKQISSNAHPIRAALSGIISLALVLSMLSFMPKAVKAADLISVNFAKIAQTGDDPSGVVGPFTGFDILISGVVRQDSAPATDETRRVAFIGRDAKSDVGIFVGSGRRLVTVADRSVNPPGLVRHLADISAPAISPFGVVFQGRDSMFRSGIFVNPTGPIGLKPIAQYGERVPTFTDPFNSVNSPNISGVFIAFGGDFPAGVADKSGIFIGSTIRTTASIVPDLFTVAVTGDDPPGPIGPLRLFGDNNAITNRGTVAIFSASDENFNHGIFKGTFRIGHSSHRRLQTIISAGDPLPGANGNLLFPPYLDVDGQELVFHAFSTVGTDSYQGIYITDLRTLITRKIAESFDAAPGVVGQFTNFAVPAISKSVVAFTASDANGNQGLYVSVDGTLSVIIDTSGMLEGKQVSKISFGAKGLKNKSLAFGVEFVDGSQAIYRADLKIE